MQRQAVDIGSIIYKRACKFTKKMTKSHTIPFPYLISEICYDAGVQNLDSDERINLKAFPIGPGIQELHKETTEPATESSQSSPPRAQEPNPEPSESIPPVSKLQSLKNDLEELRSEMKRGMMNINENMLRGFEAISEAMDDMKTGIREHRQMYALQEGAVNDEGFGDCQDTSYEPPEWIDIFPTPTPPPPTPSHPGGTSTVTSTGTTSQSKKAPTGGGVDAPRASLKHLANVATREGDNDIEMLHNLEGAQRSGSSLLHATRKTTKKA